MTTPRPRRWRPRGRLLRGHLRRRGPPGVRRPRARPPPRAVVAVASVAAATVVVAAAVVASTHSMTDLLDPGVEQTELANGLRIVTETMPEARSVSLGVWVRVGGRDEAPELSGASHFLEHLLFKGTAQRSARQIAEAVDSVGGEMNAFTAREHTAYYARLPHARLDVGLDILVRRAVGAGAATGGGRGGAAGHRRGDPHEPRRARGSRAHGAVAGRLRGSRSGSRGAG